MAIAYWTVAGITLSIILSAFLRDRATQKLSAKAWVFIATTTLIWPVTLPFIIASKLRTAKAQRQADIEEENPPAPPEDPLLGGAGVGLR